MDKYTQQPDLTNMANDNRISRRKLIAGIGATMAIAAVSPATGKL